MSENSNLEKTNAGFQLEIPEFSDEKIIDILKKRNLYQKEAADLAVQEAIKRKIIHSEQDLFADEYKVKPLKYALFPNIEKEKNRIKIRKSIARTILISGVLPLVWGIVQINKNEVFAGALFLFAAVLWMVSAAQLIRSFNKKLVFVLFLLLAVSLIYIATVFFSIKNATLMDFFVPLIVCGLLFYGLTFLLNLHEK